MHTVSSHQSKEASNPRRCLASISAIGNMRKQQGAEETRTPKSSAVPGSSSYAKMLRSPASGTIVKTLEQDADECYQSILLPINERMMGPLPQSEIITSRPMVLLLGNHSSGKSSFVNFLVGAEVQKSGVAPTDDCFTLITSGPDDTDQDGPALVGDPDLGFMGLRNFGNALISHVQLKVRKNLGLKNVILVDSPGMIDCPAVSAPAHMSTSELLRQGSSRSTARVSDSSFDRGYNFMAVTRWFAEHSDVILLFFDPDKPGQAEQSDLSSPGMGWDGMGCHTTNPPRAPQLFLCANS